ncbi:aconitase X [Acerihabitans sp. KWT182]|uniref:Aconitase X n=1 Tax=Acerihabitans sp. KWT182 TaxID=3157919 RepID=A0AAU7QEZ6_9GAMM
MTSMKGRGRFLISGSARGDVLFSHTGLSFWGGVDGASGEIIDHHHPLQGRSLAGKALAIPSGRGSCTGSSVLLELILNGHGPAALLLAEADEILALGTLVARQLFGRSLPVIALGRETFARLETCRQVDIDGDSLRAFGHDGQCLVEVTLAQPDAGLFVLNEDDRAMLAGEQGEAVRRAMEIVVYMARLQQAVGLISVSQVHIDGCIYTGSASLAFARQWLSWGGPKCGSPRRLTRYRWIAGAGGSKGSARWKASPPASWRRLICNWAPWAVLPARPICCKARPARGNISPGRSPTPWLSPIACWRRGPRNTLIFSIFVSRSPVGRPSAVRISTQCGMPRYKLTCNAPPPEADDALYPLLGHLAGELSPNAIPVVCGLEHSGMSLDDLKAFSAAFATTSAAPMFHIAGVTPEAPTPATALGHRPPHQRFTLTRTELLAGWRALNTAAGPGLQLVALGNPHLSLTEYARLARLCQEGRRHPDVALVLTSGREVYRQAREAGYVAMLESFGAQCINDTCWCMLRRPVVPAHAEALMTNSGKYAHYAPGLVGCGVHFGSLTDCIASARRGYADIAPPDWLKPFADASGNTADDATNSMVNGSTSDGVNALTGGTTYGAVAALTGGTANGSADTLTGGAGKGAMGSTSGGSQTDV